MTEYLCAGFRTRHSHSMDREMAVFQSLTAPDGSGPPSCQDNIKSARISSFICCRKYSCYDKVGGVMSRKASRVSRQLVRDIRGNHRN